MSYRSTKTYGHDVGLSACFRQWRADSHCNLLHGYALGIRFEFEADELDHRNWVVDFGGMKGLKAWLADTFDHTLLVASDDPHIEYLKSLELMNLARVIEVDACGCEAFAKLVFDCTEVWLVNNGYTPRVRLHSVEVREHGANSAIYVKDN
jgi:6-pyruvoyltetrahydropterin/6-carboxytetrahydropterin synthase